MLVNFEEAKTLIEKAIADKGADWVYPDYDNNCVYFYDDGQPACIVGHALAHRGLTIEDIGHDNETAVDCLRAVELTDDARAFWGYVQDIQDCGVSWGNAYRRALEKMESWDPEAIHS